MTPFELLKGVVVKITSEGRGPEPSFKLVYPSLFCLATPFHFSSWLGLLCVVFLIFNVHSYVAPTLDELIVIILF